MHSAPYPSGTLPRGDVAAISAGVLRAKELVQTEDYRGYDPYDALCSPIFRSPGFRARLVRRAGQQVLKRSPLNVRPLLGIQKGRNPVTLALGLHAWSLLATVDASKRAWYVAECERLVQELHDLQSRGWSGACWGYDFDWESRGATISAFHRRCAIDDDAVPLRGPHDRRSHRVLGHCVAPASRRWLRLQGYRHHTNRIQYMRWSTAWMLAGLATVLATTEATRLMQATEDMTSQSDPATRTAKEI